MLAFRSRSLFTAVGNNIEATGLLGSTIRFLVKQEDKKCDDLTLYFPMVTWMASLASLLIV